MDLWGCEGPNPNPWPVFGLFARKVEPILAMIAGLMRDPGAAKIGEMNSKTAHSVVPARGSNDRHYAAKST